MKKKITASVVAFALALALPTAAFAVEKSIEASPVAGADYVQAAVNANGIGNVNVQGAEDVTVKTVDTPEAGIADVEASLAAKIAEATKGTNLSQDEKDAIAKKMREDFYGTDDSVDINGNVVEGEKGYLDKFNEKVAEIEKGEGEYKGAQLITDLVLTGDVEGTATVRVFLNSANAQEGMTVTYVILHETQAPEYKTVTVGANGMVLIEGLTEFSYVQFYATPYATAGQGGAIDGDTTDQPIVDNGTDNGTDNVVDGDNVDKVTDEDVTPAGKSPKTGF
ncbi:hypothetical protein [Adlercreutzia murintestinalis]|uniref:hypothetical protein n=1 Tax=Adlercreutzia murintestinalis TaxID=2941325 RepID=UPI0020415ACD|nr:hypothetical protein [Adlercreutzia murintestinalis]